MTPYWIEDIKISHEKFKYNFSINGYIIYYYGNIADVNYMAII